MRQVRGFLFLLIVCLVVQARADFFTPSCSKILNIDFIDSIRNLENTSDKIEKLNYKKHPGRFNYLIDKSIAQTIEVMNHHGILWRYHEKSKRVLVIVPSQQGHEFNQLAFGLQKNMKGLRLEIDPREHRKAEAIFYEEQKNRIVIDFEIIQLGVITPPIHHEIRHAINMVKYYDGRFDLFNGSVISEKKQIHKLYPELFSLDENVSYTHENFQWIRHWQTKKPSENEYQDIKDNVRTGSVLASWSLKSSSEALGVLNKALNDFSQIKIEDEVIEYRGKTYPMKVLNVSRGKSIRIYQTEEANLQGKDQAILNVEIVLGKAQLNLNYSRYPEKMNEFETLQLVTSRLSEVNHRLKESQPFWRPLLSAVEGRKADEAYFLARKIRSIVNSVYSGP